MTVNGQTVTMTGVTSQAGLADQLKSNAAKLGISVNFDEAKKTLSVKSDTGENIEFGAVAAGAASAGAITIKAKDGSGAFAATGTALSDTTAMIATGQVSLDSSRVTPCRALVLAVCSVRLRPPLRLPPKPPSPILT